MTRQEEIEKASVEYQMSNNPICIGGDAFADMTYKLNINPSFIAGAEWADEHPINYDGKAYLYIGNKCAELTKKDLINKACKWLKENKDHPLIGCEDPCLSGYLTDKFISDFKKAMEE